ncbi:MAG TPA: GNAT family N-acetyltransferase [Bacteroidales bacterium]|jgi:GNAT superfamily N-acetyltransferase|nr:GNAT family N-acetyltransferase [Bacteroidales bacterium]HNV66428.1 GNAT family N-acetyltransferase [Bacteroidales bacterium]HPH75062.1 GNAT family N-acetyltransferase [Bacteroidales bacterium]HPK84362.1 GNAT family N-acetyltransferase [Bacteroidales bacterium]HPO40718.1 GNAT family N-acetyltransferase [Bacteroidales bacterium]
MKVNIRRANEEDFPAILALINELAEYERAPEAVTNTVEQMGRERDYFRCFVAESADHGIVGMALYFFAYFTWVGKSLYLEDIIISKQFRKRGIGEALMKRVMREAWEENCKRVRWQVLDWNEPAISFYRKSGAEINNEWLNCTFDEKGIALFNELNS